MLLRSITLNNFRQYYGEQQIVFASDPDRNVTVIIGPNTAGKTTLVQAFQWALYGKVSFKTKGFLLNRGLAEGMEPHDTEEVSVEVKLVHDGSLYTVTRVQVYMCTSRGNVQPGATRLTLDYKTPGGETEIIKQKAIESTINRILPEELARYFFFDGEQISSMSEGPDIKDAVKGLLGLAALDQAMRHLNPNKNKTVISKLNKLLSESSGRDAASLQGKLDQLVDAHTNVEKELEQTDSELDQLERRSSELSEVLRANAETAKLQMDKDQKEADLKTAESKQNETYKFFREHFQRSSLMYFAKPLILQALAALKDTQVVDKGVPNMTAKSIDFLIERGVCVCGCRITPNGQAHDHLLIERAFLPPESLGTSLRAFQAEAKAYSNANDYLPVLARLYGDIYGGKVRMGDLRDDIDSISKAILGAPDVAKYEQEQRHVKERLRQLKGRRDNLIRREEIAKRDVDRCRDDLTALLKQSEKDIKVATYLQYAQNVYEWLADTYQTREESIRERLQDRVTNIFNEMYHGKRKVIINDSYGMELEAEVASGRTVGIDESPGLRTVKSFAFVSGLVQLAREKLVASPGDEQAVPDTSEPYPLVMDAPFSNADERHVERIAAVLPTIAEQVIMVLTSKDWAHAEPSLTGRIGKSYRLEKRSEVVTKIQESGDLV